MSRMLLGFLRDETGQDLMEYALLASFLSIATIAALKILGSKISKSLQPISRNLP